MQTDAVNLKGRSLWRHALATLAGLVLSLAILAYLLLSMVFKTGDPRVWLTQAESVGQAMALLADFWREVLERLVQANGTILLSTIVLSAAFHHFIGAHKQWCVLRAMQVDITYIEALWLRLGSGPLRTLVPLEAGELVNIVYFWRHKKMPFGRASGAMIFDRGLNIIGTSVWLLVGLILLADVANEWRALLLIGAGTAYGLFFFFTPLHDWVVRTATRILPKAGRFVEGVLAPFREFSVRQKFFFMAYGAFFQLRPLAVCYLLFRAFGVSPSPAHSIGYTSLAVMAGHTPGVFMGSGPRESAISFFFAGYATDDVLFSVGVLMTLTVHAIPVFLGIPWVWWVLKRLAKKESPLAAPQAKAEGR